MEQALQRVLQEKFQKDIKDATKEEIYTALLFVTKEKMQGMKANTGDRKLYYISAEFLIGKLLSNNLINLGVFEETREVLKKYGHDLTQIEEVELEPGKAPAEEIIAYRLTPQLTEQKVLGSRLVLKGELAGHVLYRTQGEGGLAVTDFVLPLSQIIDLEGLSEEDECQVYLSAQGSEVRLESGGEGESGRLMVDGVISVMIRVHRREEAQVVEDSFSTLYPSEEKTAQITLPSLVSQLDCSRTCRFVVPVPSQMTQVLEAWCRLGGVSAEQTEEGLSVVLRFGITLIGLEEDGSLTMADRSEECRGLVLPGATGQLQAEPEAWITASSFSMQPTGEAEVRCEVRLAGPVYENST